MVNQLRYFDGSTHIMASLAEPYPVQVVSQSAAITTPDVATLTVQDMMARGLDWYGILAGEGRQFYASDADYDDKVTGQTSFADTTGTFILRVPTGTVAVPLLVALGQSGTVAGGPISVIIGLDNEDPWASGGTSETVFAARTGFATPVSTCTLVSTPTITTAKFGARIFGVTVAADVEPAEGISNEVIWTPTGPDFLKGPAAMVIYTWAAVTGPTWFWEIKWLEFPTARLGFS